jgi:uncharacterized protein (TIGR03435 family)
VFDVASIKPVSVDWSHVDPNHIGPRFHPGRVSFWSMNIHSLVGNAYATQNSFPQVTGPARIDNDYYDIEATFPVNSGPSDIQKMLQALLKDRFKLTFHTEKRERTIYALVVGKHGAKLMPAESGIAALDMTVPLKPGEKYLGEGSGRIKSVTNADGSSKMVSSDGKTTSIAYNKEDKLQQTEINRCTMVDLAGEIQRALIWSGEKLDVVDQTGIKGEYQVAYSFAFSAGDTEGESQGSVPLLNSLEKMGLTLQKTKVQDDFYVIDHVEKPSEN